MKKKKKKGITPSSRKRKRKKRVRFSEITGIFLIFLAVFLLISLISYNPNDPSWATATYKGQKAHNFAGKAGASTSEALLQFLGFTSFILPFALFYMGIKVLFPEEKKRFILKTGEICFFIIILSSLLYISFLKLLR